jgi:hypothetical protein
MPPQSISNQIPLARWTQNIIWSGLQNQFHQSPILNSNTDWTKILIITPLTLMTILLGLKYQLYHHKIMEITFILGNSQFQICTLQPDIWYEYQAKMTMATQNTAHHSNLEQKEQVRDDFIFTFVKNKSIKLLGCCSIIDCMQYVD